MKRIQVLFNNSLLSWELHSSFPEMFLLSLKNLLISQHLQWESKPQQTDTDRPYENGSSHLLVEKDTSLKSLRILGIRWLDPGARTKYIFHYKYLKYYFLWILIVGWFLRSTDHVSLHVTSFVVCGKEIKNVLSNSVSDSDIVVCL